MYDVPCVHLCPLPNRSIKSIVRSNITEQCILGSRLLIMFIDPTRVATGGVIVLIYVTFTGL